MPDELNPLGGASASTDSTTQPTPPAGTATPAVQPAASLSAADVEKLLAAQEAKFQVQLGELAGGLKGTVMEALQGVFQGKQPQPPKKGTTGGQPAPTTQPDPAAEKPWTKDPEYLAQQTKQRELEAKQAEIEKTLETERAARRKAEREAEKSAIQQSVINELIDVDNPVRADASVAKTAAELLILRGVVVKSDTDKKLYVKTIGEDGQEKTVSLRDGVRAWLNGPEGARFRPALPTGAGSSAGSAYAPLSNLDTPLTEADLFKSALLKDQKLRASGAN